MRLNTIRYYFREAFYSIFRNNWISIASVGVVAVSLLILGGSLLLVLNANHLARGLESSVEITLFLRDKTSRDQVTILKQRLLAMDGVASAEFIPKEQALEEMKRNLGEKRDILAGLEEKNPLPDAFRVKARQVEQVSLLAGRFEGWPEVDQVRYGQGVVEKLMALSRWVRTAGLVTMLLLGAAAIFLIATTIRLSVFARRREIEIMKFLGATNWFVRFPFLLEGVILGLCGSLLAVAALYFGYGSLVGNLQLSLPFMELITDRGLILPVLEALLGLGLLIGAMGSIISMRRFLKA
ncbi:MAG: permease-like cell division protein FtsX [Firmicutes bacterium]|nr:permease-like cell division protein FtsX [Bacillota bacterium]